MIDITHTDVASKDRSSGRSLHAKTMFGATMGTIFEWYDFTLYGALASILAVKFFANTDPAIGFVFALMTFGVGFIVRPLGSIVFGHLGDKLGRKKMFVVTVLIMGLSTCCVGALPTYADIGIWAPILLILLRVLQGLALGGEYGGAVTYVAEHADPKKRGFATSFMQMGGTLGLLISLIVIQLIKWAIPNDAFEAWGWRLPFLLSVIMVAISMKVRLGMHESPVFQQLKERHQVAASPLKEAFGNWANLRRIAVALFGLSAGMTVIYYVTIYYSLFFLTQSLKVPANSANLIIALATIFCLPMFCLAGWLSDRIGRKPVILFGLGMVSITIFPIFHAISGFANPALMAAQTNSPVSISFDSGSCSFMFNPVGTRKFNAPCDVARQTLASYSVNYTSAPRPAESDASVTVGSLTIPFAVSGDVPSVAIPQAVDALKKALKDGGYPTTANPSAYDLFMVLLLLWTLIFFMAMGFTPVTAALVEMFPARIRYTSMSFPYQLASGWFGGLLPTFAFAISAEYGNIFSGLWYAVGWLVTAFVITGLFFKETKDVDITV